MSSSSNPSAPPRVAALDGVRGLAVLAVLLCHTTGYSGVPATGRISHAWAELASALSTGVELFFVLSGFLITGILLDTKGHPGWIGRFYARRALRIFPLYYATLAFAFLVVPRLFPVDAGYEHVVSRQAWYWSYLTNFLFAREGWPQSGFLGHFWTLAIEEQFYLFWPTLVALLSIRTLRRLCLFGLLIGIAIRTPLTLNDARSTLDLITPSQLDGLLVGAWLAIRFREPGGAEKLARWAPGAAALSFAVVFGLVIYRDGWDRSSDPFRIAIQPVLAVLYGSLVAIAASTAPAWGTFRRRLSHPFLTAFGKYGYGYYVFHAPIVVLLNRHGLDARLVPEILGSHLPGIALYTVVVGAVSFAVAYSSYHLFEDRFLRLKDRFSPAPRARAATAPASPPGARTAGAEAAGPGA